MRGVWAFGSVVALLAAGCDGGANAVTAPATGTAPRFATSAQAATRTIISQRYETFGEGFLLCDGGAAYGDITWNEVDARLDFPDGSFRFRVDLNMLGGRAVGPDGTEYILHQVNQSQNTFESPSNTFDLRQTVRIAAISPGSEGNLFYQDDLTVHFDPVNGFSTTHTVTVDCRG